MKLNDILDELIEEYNQKGQYHPIDSLDEANITTALLLGELLNPENAYQYFYDRGCYRFKDDDGIIFTAIMTSSLGKTENFCEFKTFWYEPNSRIPIYNKLPQNSSGIVGSKRSDTVAKIFRDEIIPKFKQQDFAQLLVFNPVSHQRYLFSMRLIKKFIPKDWEIEEQYPKRIIIRKPK